MALQRVADAANAQLCGVGVWFYTSVLYAAQLGRWSSSTSSLKVVMFCTTLRQLRRLHLAWYASACKVLIACAVNVQQQRTCNWACAGASAAVSGVMYHFAAGQTMRQCTCSVLLQSDLQHNATVRQVCGMLWCFVLQQQGSFHQPVIIWLLNSSITVYRECLFDRRAILRLGSL
jgi:hypothetical protein